jgi:hypothetical protein
MPTLNTILKELKDVPVSRLEELYQFIHSLKGTVKPTETTRLKILSFEGAFKEMSDEDYADFLEQTQETRKYLFNRGID